MNIKTAAFAYAMRKSADMATAARPISQAHGVKRIAQLTAALKNRVQKSTPHLKSLPAGERFRAFAMENPGVAERAKATAKRFASTSGLKTAGFHRYLVKNAISAGLAGRVAASRAARSVSSSATVRDVIKHDKNIGLMAKRHVSSLGAHDFRPTAGSVMRNQKPGWRAAVGKGT